MVTRGILPPEGVEMRWCQWSQDGFCHLRESEWEAANGHKTDFVIRGSRIEMVPMVTTDYAK